MTRKWSRLVRRGEVGKGPAMVPHWPPTLVLAPCAVCTVFRHHEGGAYSTSCRNRRWEDQGLAGRTPGGEEGLVSVVPVENQITAAGSHPLPEAVEAVKDSRKQPLLTRAGADGMPMAETLGLSPQRELSQLAMRQVPSTQIAIGLLPSSCARTAPVASARCHAVL